MLLLSPCQAAELVAATLSYVAGQSNGPPILSEFEAVAPDSVRFRVTGTDQYFSMKLVEDA